MENKASETHSFQAEVQQLLKIVVHSLYTDREIFLRELVSNASDALEKLRHLQLTESNIYDADLPLEINITTDDKANTVTIQDFGIGMSREELKENLGTIAHSGSRVFLEALKQQGKNNEELIGQFGVGFYSAFMVADEVRVYTHSWRSEDESLLWFSDGTGSYQIEPSSGERRGTKVVVKLKKEFAEFATESKVRAVLERYSRFVQFPVQLNGERINTQEAIWLQSKAGIEAERYQEFYRFLAHTTEDAADWLHFNADAPLAINALVYFPKTNPERLGFGKQEPGVALYSRKVLIDPNPEGLLPEWLRFLKGIIDSADLPLNISRESMQDSALVHKLSRVVTKRIIRHLKENMKKNSELYASFWKQFGIYIKEGIASDFEYREDLAPLLRFESSATERKQTVSLDEYVERMPAEQNAIYYLSGQSREAIESSPYIEALKARDIEVLFFYEPIDEFVSRNIGVYKEKQLLAADSANLNLGEQKQQDETTEALDKQEAQALCNWLKQTLEKENVAEVKVSDRLVNSPAAAFCSDSFMTPGMQRILSRMNDSDEPQEAIKINLEINPANKLIRNLDKIRTTDPELATGVAEQILDNALIAAGLLDDTQKMSARLSQLLEQLTSKAAN